MLLLSVHSTQNVNDMHLFTQSGGGGGESGNDVSSIQIRTYIYIYRLRRNAHINTFRLCVCLAV